MGAVCGVIGKRNMVPGERLVKPMLNAMREWQPDSTSFVAFENTAFGLHFMFTHSETARIAGLKETDRYIFVHDADRDFLSGLFQEVTSNQDINTRIDHFLSDPSGSNGDFAVAAWDKYKKKLVLVRDHLGKRPLFYTETQAYFAFATEMKALFTLPGFVPVMDEQWIADSISTVKSEKDRSPYKNIKRLLPGNLMIIDRRETRLRSYWDLVFQPETERLKKDEALYLFHEKMVRSVNRKIEGAVSVGSELSGGLDSSGITALAWAFLKDKNIPFFALSHAFSDSSLGKYFPYKDEREFSQALIRHTGIPNHLFCPADERGIIETLKKTIHIQSGPTQQGYNIFADALYDRAEENGVRILLSGFGGDEGVTSQGAGIYEELIKKMQWSELKNELLSRAELKHKSRQKALLRYYLTRYTPMAMRMIRKLISDQDWRIPKFKGLAFDETFGRTMHIRERYYERVGFPDDPDVRARQYKRIMHQHVSERFEYSYLAARNRRMEYAYPFWDPELVAFYFSLPAGLKVRDGQRRYLYREAMRGILPEKIRLRDDKTGATVPTVQMRFMNDYENIRKLILHSKEVNKTHYLDYDKMLAWQERIKNRGFKDKIPANPGAFFNSLQILLLQEMGRSGEL